MLRANRKHKKAIDTDASQAQQYTPVIPEPGGWSQECQKFRIILHDIASSKAD